MTEQLVLKTAEPKSDLERAALAILDKVLNDEQFDLASPAELDRRAREVLQALGPAYLSLQLVPALALVQKALATGARELIVRATVKHVEKGRDEERKFREATHGADGLNRVRGEDVRVDADVMRRASELGKNLKQRGPAGG